MRDAFLLIAAASAAAIAVAFSMTWWPQPRRNIPTRTPLPKRC